jgi:hypothetical protein
MKKCVGCNLFEVDQNCICSLVYFKVSKCPCWNCIIKPICTKTCEAFDYELSKLSSIQYKVKPGPKRYLCGIRYWPHFFKK